MRFSPTRLFVAEAGCLYPFRAEVQPKPEPENAKMRRGNAIHRDIETGITCNAEPASPEARGAFLWQKGRGEGARLAEFCVGVDLATGKAEAFDGREDVPADWMPVIVDLAIVGPVLEVWDWKTGSPFSSFDYLPQIRAGAFAVATHLGRDEAVAGLAYVSRDGIRPKDWSLDMFDFAEQRRKLKLWAAAAPTAEPIVNAACRYCPARTVCPAQAQEKAS